MIGPAKKAQFGRVAYALGCAVTGSMSARRHSGETLVLDSTKVDEISVGGRVVRAVTAGIADIRRMLPPGAPPVIGALSAVFLSRHPATFDLERDRIIFESRNFLSERRKGRGVEMKPRFPARGCMDLFVEVLTQNGRRGWFELDTCSTTVLLNQEIWGETGKSPPLRIKIQAGLRLKTRSWPCGWTAPPKPLCRCRWKWQNACSTAFWACPTFGA